jgi:alkylation response protein AidB-like acyl-CoA dehydrogenase
MNFDLTEDQRLLQDSVARFLADHCDVETRLRNGGLVSAPLWRQFAELGWLGVALPEAVGGIGGGAVETMVMMEAFGRSLVVEPYLASVLLGGGLLRRCAADDLLGRLIEGNLQLAFGFAEPRSRFDLAHVETVARVDGNGWRLDGAKALVLNADGADLIIVTARLGAMLGLFLVPRDQAGLTVRPCRTHDGMAAAEVRLDAVRVGRDALLSADALALVEEVVDEASAAIAAEALGAMAVLVEASVEYLKLRRQFGRPLASFQVLQHRLVEMQIELEETRSLVIAATLALEEAPAQRRRAVSAAKIKIGQAGRLIGEEAIQLHGGIGMTEDVKVGHYYKRLLSRATLFGDVDHHVGRYAEALA